MLVQVDDCLIVGSSAGVRHVTDSVKALFEVKDIGAVSFLLGLEVLRDRATRTLWLGQPRYVDSGGVVAPSVPCTAQQRVSESAETAKDLHCCHLRLIARNCSTLGGCWIDFKGL